MPTLVLQCSDDVIAPPAVGDYVHRQIAGSTLVLLDATGHCPNLSAPEETVAAITAFLAPRERGGVGRHRARAVDAATPRRCSRTAPRTSTSTRRAATCPPTRTARIARVNQTFLTWTGYAARRARRRAPVRRPAQPRAAGSTTRRTTRRCCGCRARSGRSRSTWCAADGEPDAGAGQLRPADRCGRPAARRAHHRLRRHRPQGVRDASCSRRGAGPSRPPPGCSAVEQVVAELAAVSGVDEVGQVDGRRRYGGLRRGGQRPLDGRRGDERLVWTAGERARSVPPDACRPRRRRLPGRRGCAGGRGRAGDRGRGGRELPAAARGPRRGAGAWCSRR